MKDDLISRQAAIKTLMAVKTVDPSIVGCASNAGVDWCIDAITALPSAQPMEDIRAMCSECDAWNKYKNYPQPEQFNPCTVCQELDCTGCKFRRMI